METSVDYSYFGEWGQKVLRILEQKTSINSETGCWEWIGGDDEGYGCIRIDHVKYRIHRLSAMLFLGYHPEYTNLCVLHKCNNRKCWNHEHLYIGTKADNVQDSKDAGTARGRFSDATHCIHGHELTPENVYLHQRSDGRSQRLCRTCRKIASDRKQSLKFGKVG